MRPDPAKSIWRVIEIVVGLALIATGLAYIKHQLTVTFQTYDDEGYMLLSLAHYLRDGALYTKTYSQYGPFYYYLQQFLHWLFHLPVNHDGGRTLILFYCWISSLLAGIFVWRLARNILIGSSAALAVAILSCKLADEPGHPEEVVLFLLLLGVFLSSFAARNRSSAVLFVLGGVGAALSLTKVNVGAFYTVALAHTLICVLQPGRLRRFAIGLTLVYAAAVPLVLMRAHFATWAGWYCILSVICGVVVFAQGATARAHAYLSVRHLLYATAGFVVVAATVAGASFFQGLSAYTLLDGIILSPAGHPQLFWVPWRLGPPVVLWAILAAIAVAAAVRFRSRVQPYSEWIEAALCMAGAATILLLTFHPKRLGWMIPLLPMLLLRVRTNEWRLGDLLPRLFITDQAVTQLLHPYPVASTQAYVAAVPAVIWGFVAVSDGLPGLATLAARFLPWFGPPIRSHAALPQTVAVAIGLALTAGGLHQGLGFTTSDAPLDLPGARSLRLRPERAARFRWLASTIHVNCDTLFTMPGMGSLNFWSGIPTPNGSNLPAWVKAFSTERQQDILDILKAHPRACVVYHPKWLAFVLPGGAEPVETSLLATYILKDMRIAEAGEGYEIRVLPERTSPWIRVARN